MGEIIDLPVITTLDIPPEKILKRALKANLTDVLIVGWDENGDLYFAASQADGPNNLWLLNLAERGLIEASLADDD